MKKTFTRSGLEKLKKELVFLEKEKRREVAEKLKTAAAFGDLSENSAYEEAKNEQTVLETRIAKLREMIKDAQVVDSKSGTDIVQIGSKILTEINSKTSQFEIVGETESDPFQGKISCDSPIGRSFLGKKKGDVCIVKTPSGEKSYKIKEIID